MIESIKLQANTLKPTRPLGEICLEYLLRIPWAMGWLVGYLWYVVRLIVAAVMVGFKAGMG